MPSSIDAIFSWHRSCSSGCLVQLTFFILIKETRWLKSFYLCYRTVKNSSLLISPVKPWLARLFCQLGKKPPVSETPDLFEPLKKNQRFFRLQWSGTRHARISKMFSHQIYNNPVIVNSSKTDFWMFKFFHRTECNSWAGEVWTERDKSEAQSWQKRYRRSAGEATDEEWSSRTSRGETGRENTCWAKREKEKEWEPKTRKEGDEEMQRQRKRRRPEREVGRVS